MEAQRPRPAKLTAPYRGHELDPFVLTPTVPLREGVYLLAFASITPDPMNPTEERRVEFSVQGRLDVNAHILRWEALDPMPTATCRLKQGEGRTGMFVRRFHDARPTVFPKFSRWVRAGVRQIVQIDLALLVGQDYACWLVPEGDGLYLVNMADPADRDELRTWTLEGATDAR